MYDIAAGKGAKYPELVAAQWALESDWGKKPSGKNNYFGLKAAPGEASSTHNTWEVEGGKNVNTSAQFMDFDNPEDSIGTLVTRWHADYKGYKGVNNANSAGAAADMLLSENYATDPKYAEKLKRIMREQGYNV